MFDELLAEAQALVTKIEAAQAAAAPVEPPAPDDVEMTIRPLTADLVTALEAKGYTVTAPTEG